MDNWQDQARKSNWTEQEISNWQAALDRDKDRPKSGGDETKRVMSWERWWAQIPSCQGRGDIICGE